MESSRRWGDPARALLYPRHMDTQGVNPLRRVTRQGTPSIETQSKRCSGDLMRGSENDFVDTTKTVRWKACSTIQASVSNDGVFLLDLADEYCYGLDALGAQIWLTIENSPSGIAFDDILDVLEAHFHSPRNKLAEDLRFQLQRLHALGFIETLRKT